MSGAMEEPADVEVADLERLVRAARRPSLSLDDAVKTSQTKYKMQNVVVHC